MSVSSHFVPNHPHLRMPKTHDGADPIGIKWSGDVLQGNLSTSEAFAIDRARAAARLTNDPVLAAHFAGREPRR